MHGHDISWKHLEQLHLVETEKTGGMRLCPKLTRDHILLNPYTPVHELIEQYALDSGNSLLTLIYMQSETVATALQFWIRTRDGRHISSSE